MSTLLRSTWARDLAIFFGLLSVALLVEASFAHSVFATALIQPTDNPGAVAGATGGESDIRSLTQTILNFFLGFLGFVATIMVIYGGGLYVTAAGNEDNASKGKTVIMYAVIGIIIILISFALINTVLGAGTGSGGTTTTTTTVVPQ